MVAAIAVFFIASPAFAQIIYDPIPTHGFDEDIIFEAGLAIGAPGATGELGSRQFYEQGAYPTGDRGLARILPTYTSPTSGNMINFGFAPFEENNILIFDSTNTPATPKTLTFGDPKAYSNLAVVFSGGSLGTTTATLAYTINYVGGGTESGDINVLDWGATAAATTTAEIEKLINADRTNADALVWGPPPQGNSASDIRWSIYVKEIPVMQGGLAIESVSFTASLAGAALAGSSDVAVFGLAGPGASGLPGDVNGDEVVDILDFNVIRDNLQQSGNRADGDLTLNGFVDLRDFRAWKSARFPAAAGLGAGAAVPEPTSGLMLLMAIAMLACRCGGLRPSR